MLHLFWHERDEVIYLSTDCFGRLGSVVPLVSCEITSALIFISLSISKVVWVGVQFSIFAVQMRTRIVSAVDEFPTRIMYLK